MATFITVLPGGGPNDPHEAVQGCHFQEPLMRFNFFNSQFQQTFPKSSTDQDLGTKQITNIKTGSKITCRVFRLQQTHPIIPQITVPGCQHVQALGFTKEVENLVEDFNFIAKEKLKLKKQAKKLKDLRK
ncbi:hypothetical protein [Paraflavitalea soli]|nr:hypothetical protein [Paraflavitalea soli]